MFSKSPDILITLFALMSGSAAYVALSQNELPLPAAIAVAVVIAGTFIFAGIFFKTGRGRFGAGNDD